ncbi:hypothetical protein [Halosimplex pelagicum]|uniref:Methanogenesis regulatory protein FilR1 middle domain-containing protein n=1 Tax=Halosimplex pelagicum TaxID=869886 RepID=A0A7D5PAD8_9EURY|nr:hypothetical protein [Halosimplex pelagicum]QLH81078.1 hypothetical protein HZS54_05235 [Halosimplex pelagicum]
MPNYDRNSGAEDTEFEMTQSKARKANEIFSWFGGSEQRIQLFADLYDGISQEEMKRKYNDSFLSNQRENLNSFGFYRKDGDTHRLTPLGEKVYEPFIELCRQAQIVEELRPILHAIPSDSDNTPPIEDLYQAVRRGEVRVVAENMVNEFAVLTSYREAVGESQTLREIVIGILRPHGFHDQVTEGELQAEYIYPSKVFEEITNNADRLELAQEHAEMSVDHHIVDEQFPFNLSILDQSVIIWARRPTENKYRVMLETDASEIREWATDLFERKKVAAEPVDWSQ